jgi:predicted nicotinamide N-methyase
MQQLQNCIKKGGKKAVRAVELGAGCGIFGIALAQMLPRCAVTLTDLPEVDEIVSRNIQAARLAPGSALDFQVLDWDEKPSDDVFGEAVDLVLVSDCTYNADSLPALVRVLGYLTNVSPHALVLVSLKRRHESEAVFFELMQKASFAILEQTDVSLPAPYSETDSIEMYAFGRT